MNAGSKHGWKRLEDEVAQTGRKREIEPGFLGFRAWGYAETEKADDLAEKRLNSKYHFNLSELEIKIWFNDVATEPYYKFTIFKCNETEIKRWNRITNLVGENSAHKRIIDFNETNEPEI